MENKENILIYKIIGILSIIGFILITFFVTKDFKKENVEINKTSSQNIEIEFLTDEELNISNNVPQNTSLQDEEIREIDKTPSPGIEIYYNLLEENIGIDKTSPLSIEFDYESFNENKSEWLNKNLNDYSYNYSYGCGEGWGNYDVVVKDKRVIQVVDKNSGGALQQSENEKYSIDNIFKRIEEIYLNNKNKTESEGCNLKSIEVEYDNEYFYPIRYSTNYRCSPSMMDGGGCTYRISDFNVID